MAKALNNGLSPLGQGIFFLFKIAHETSNFSGLIRLSCHSVRARGSGLCQEGSFQLPPFILNGSRPLAPTIHLGQAVCPHGQVTRMRLECGR